MEHDSSQTHTMSALMSIICPFQLQTPTGNTIWIGITGFGNGVIYGVANPVDVSDFLGTDAESNPVLIKMYI